MFKRRKELIKKYNLEENIEIEGQVVSVDKSIAQIIKKLNDNGLKTSYSCSGLKIDHPKEGRHPIFYISFPIGELDEKNARILNCLAEGRHYVQYNNENMVVEINGEKYKLSDVKDVLEKENIKTEAIHNFRRNRTADIIDDKLCNNFYQYYEEINSPEQILEIIKYKATQSCPNDKEEILNNIKIIESPQFIDDNLGFRQIIRICGGNLNQKQKELIECFKKTVKVVNYKYNSNFDAEPDILFQSGEDDISRPKFYSIHIADNNKEEISEERKLKNITRLTESLIKNCKK